MSVPGSSDTPAANDFGGNASVPGGADASLDGRYRTIVADPPWEQSDRRRRAGVSFPKSGGTTNTHLTYPTMTVKEIIDLEVATLAAADAHLFLWVTQRQLEYGHYIARAWDFEPSYALVWCKPPHGWGPGGVFQSTVEFVIYARRGCPEPSTQAVRSQHFEWPRRGGHSSKPEAFFDLIEAHFPGPYLEMFARRNRLGWDTFGDESLNHVELGAA